MFEATIDNYLCMRTLSLQDAEELFDVIDENRDHLRQWLPWLDCTTKPEHIRQFIESVLRKDAKNQGFTCGIILQGRIVGVVGYNWIRWGNRSAELGYWLGRTVVGQGMVTRCCRVLIDYAFNTLGLNRIEIPVAVGNQRSRAIPERLGFRQEGTIRDAEWLYDHFVDHVLYGMLKRDWNSQ